MGSSVCFNKEMIMDVHPNDCVLVCAGVRDVHLDVPEEGTLVCHLDHEEGNLQEAQEALWG